MNLKIPKFVRVAGGTMIAVFGLVACAQRNTPPVQVTELTMEQLAGATYSGVYERPVTLTDGEYIGDPFVEGGTVRPRVQLLGNFLLRADLTGDGAQETVVLLAESSGGSGTFEYIAVMRRQGDDVTNAGTAPLGDRVQVRDWRIDNQTISIDVIQTGPNDAACCPTEKATRVWKLDDRGLVELTEQVTGSVSVSDLGGVEWVLRQFGPQGDVAEDAGITFVIDDDRVSGHAGCNRYMGSVNTKDGAGAIGFGPLAGTMMACPQDLMELERRYLKALAGVHRFSFLIGRLALTSIDAEGHVSTLVFEGRPERM